MSVAAAAPGTAAVVAAAVGGGFAWLSSRRATREAARAREAANEIANRAAKVDEMDRILTAQRGMLDGLQSENERMSEAIRACEERDREKQARLDDFAQQLYEVRTDRAFLVHMVQAEVAQEAARRWANDPEERRSGSERRG